MAFTVSLNGTPKHDVRLKASTIDVAGSVAKRDLGDGRDYVGFTGRDLTFAAGASGEALTQTVDVTILGDRVVETDEQFVLRLHDLSSNDARVGFAGGTAQAEATGTILDDDDADDPVVTVSVADASVSEGDRGRTAMTFTVSLSDSPSHEVRLKAAAVAGASGTATSDAGNDPDYTGFTGRELVFAAGATGDALSQTVDVQVLGDHVVEPDETFVLRINNLESDDERVDFPNGATRVEALGTILNDDDVNDEAVIISVADASVIEGNAGHSDLEFIISLSAPPSHDVRLKVSALSGSKGTAKPRGDERDYVRIGGDVLTFAANASGDELNRTVTVKVVGDDRYESDEQLILRVNGLRTGDDRVRFANHHRTKIEAIGTILNDDAPPTTTLPLRVALDTDAAALITGPFTVTARFSRPVTALAPSDFISVNSTVAAVAGSGSEFEVTVSPDADGAVMLRLPAGAVASLGGDTNLVSAPLIRVRRQAPPPADTGFDVWNRTLVLSEHGAEFSRAEPAWGYTGDVAVCRAGTTGSDYRASVIQRVNWYRQMAGLGTVTEDATMSAGAQQAALIMLANRRVSHRPDASWTCYTALGAQYAAKSNLGLAAFNAPTARLSEYAGVHGIDRYMRDDGSNNLRVGHRRSILYPQTRRMGTGNLGTVDAVAHALAARDENLNAPRPPVREARGFVAWPAAGYATAEQVWGRWSFSLRGADFSAATVTLADDAGSVPVQVIHRDSSPNLAPEPSIVFAIDGDTDSVALPEPQGADRCFAVTVTGVLEHGKTAPSAFEYPVCVIDSDAATGPTATVTSSAPAVVVGTFDVGITFSEPVTDFDETDLKTLNATVTSLSGSGASYTATIRPNDEGGAVAVSVLAGAVHDSHYRPSEPSAPLTRTARIGKPRARVEPPDSRRVSGPFTVRIVFSEPVSGFSAGGLLAVNAVVTGVTGQGAQYRATINPTGGGHVTLRVRDSAATGTDDRSNTASAPVTLAYVTRGVVPQHDLSLSNWQRDSILAGYIKEFNRTEPDTGLTGADPAKCVAGDTSDAFRASVISRINWYRGIAGVRPVTENSTRRANANAVALMYASGNHSAEPAGRCYTKADVSGGGYSATIWSGGVKAINELMGGSGFPRLINALLVDIAVGYAGDPAVAQTLSLGHGIPDFPATRDPRVVVAWPSPGFVPAEVVPDSWSFMVPGVDFANARVSVESHLGTHRITGVKVERNRISWSFASGHEPSLSGPAGADACYVVTITGGDRGAGELEQPYQYAVCVIPPRSGAATP